jgi:hypothetical protein
MVYGGGNPTVQHPTEESAKAEAERLARVNRGNVFAVLEAIAFVRSTDVVWADALDEDDDVQF